MSVMRVRFKSPATSKLELFVKILKNGATDVIFEEAVLTVCALANSGKRKAGETFFGCKYVKTSTNKNPYKPLAKKFIFNKVY